MNNLLGTSQVHLVDIESMLLAGLFCTKCIIIPVVVVCRCVLKVTFSVERDLSMCPFLEFEVSLVERK